MVRPRPFAVYLLAGLCATLAFALPAVPGQAEPSRAGSAVPLTGGPDAFGYTWDRNVQFDWIDATDGTSAPWMAVGPYPIGFSFDFYGTSYSQFYLSAGLIQFGFGNSLPWFNQCIPTAGLPDSFAAPFWDYVVSGQMADVVFCKTLGNAPERRLVVEWFNMQHGYDSAYMTWEAVLYEGSSDIRFQYLSMTANSWGNAQSATIGLENQSGEIGLQVSCDEGWLQDGSAILFRHPRAGPTPSPTSAPSRGGPDAFGYTWDRSVSFEWVDTSGGVQVPGGDDFCRGPYTIGFPFNFYGTTYTQFSLNTNGFVWFGEACEDGPEPWTNRCIPDAPVPNTFAAPFWDDLEPTGGGILRYRLLGSAPDRFLVVEWNGVGHYSDFVHPMTFQAVFFEGSNDIKFQYQSMAGNSRGDASSATIGIENQHGTDGLNVSCNAGWLLDGAAVLFTYPGGPTRTPTRTAAATPTPRCPDPYEPNEAFGQAWDLGKDRSIESYICSPGDVDFFRASRGDSTATCFQISLSHLPANYDLRVYDGEHALIGSSSNPGTFDEALTVWEPLVYVQVVGTDSAFNRSIPYYLDVAPRYLPTPTPTRSPVPTARPAPTAYPEPTKAPLPTCTAPPALPVVQLYLPVLCR